MYGKHFGSMYEGSMVGAGAVVFAVMGYVIAKQTPDREVGSQVRLNPVLLAAILGEGEKEIERAIEKLSAPDPRSTTKSHDGRRLIKIGEFDYQVVNGAKYRAIRNEEARMEQNRVAQRKHREKKQPAKNGWKAKVEGGKSPGEVRYEKLAKSGATPEQLDKVVTASLPEQCQ